MERTLTFLSLQCLHPFDGLPTLGMASYQPHSSCSTHEARAQRSGVWNSFSEWGRGSAWLNKRSRFRGVYGPTLSQGMCIVERCGARTAV